MTRDSSGGLPRSLGGYELLERVGAGGMGVVYKATDRRSSTTVAIKVIHEHLQNDSSFVSRFRDEAHLASLLASPYIVRVIEFGFDQGQYFLATEYVEGSRLSDVIAAAGDGLGVEESLAVAVQVTMALQAAAAHRVVHRDVKPDNIVITQDKSVKLMDFGIARLSYVETRQLFLGTVAYAAPEQFRGQTTVRSDIYSLGVVLFQMLTGELPFKGETLSSLMRMHDETPPPLEKLDGMPSGIRDVVAKCLEKDPSKRYQDPSELLAALRQVRQSLPTPPDPTWIYDTITRITDTIMPAMTAGTVRMSTSAAEQRQPVVQDVYAPPVASQAAPPPPTPPPSAPTRGQAAPKRVPLIAGAAAALGALAAGLFFALGSEGGSNSSQAEPTAVAAAAEPTPAPEPTPVPAPPAPVEPPAPAPVVPPPAPAPVVVAPPPAAAPAAPPPAPPAPVVIPPTSTPVPPPPPAPASGAVFNFVGFSDHIGPNNGAPGDVISTGGNLRACNPSSLYAFLNFSNLQPPKQFIGSWTLNGSFLNQQAFTQDRTSSQTFFQVQATPNPLTSGMYRFQLTIDGSVVSQGSFTLSC